MSPHLVEYNMLAPCSNPPNCLLCHMAYKMPFEPQHPTILHPWGCPCSLMIKGTLHPKGVEQFGHSSQEKDFGYERYLVLLVQ